MEFGRGFSIPMGNSWVPITPEKSFPAGPSLIPVIPVESQPAKSNWGELLGIYTGFLQENPVNADVADQNFSSTREFNGEDQSFDPNFVGSYVENFGNQNSAWNNNPLAELLMQHGNADVLYNRPKGVNAYTHFEAASSTLMHQNRAVDLNQRSNGYILQQMPSDGFQIPYCTNDNRYSPPKSVGDAASSVTNPFPFTPITPDQAKQLQNQRLSEIANHLIDDCSSHDKDKGANLAISVSDEVQNHYEELLQNIVDSSSVDVSKMAREKDKGSDEGHELGFDLNKTPDQKTPAKRRKHRPKVVKEGKPKATRTPTGPKIGEPKENSTGKRKYVRKKGVKVLEESENPGGANGGTEPARLKSCRRALNFDSENVPQDETRGHEETNQGREKGFNLNLDCQENDLNEVETEGQNGNITENNNRMGSTMDLNCSTSKMPGGRILLAEQHAPLTPQAKPKDRALNLIARNLSSRNLNPCEIFLRADTTTTSPNARNNGLSQSRGTSEVLLQTETTNFNENRGSKREYCRTIEQMRPHSINTIGSPILRVGEKNAVVHNLAAESLETRKKMKTVNGFQELAPNILPCTTTPGEDFGTGDINGSYLCKATSQINSSLFNSYFPRESALAKLVNGVHGVGGERRIYPVGPTWVEEERLKRRTTRVHDLHSLTALTNWTQLSSDPIKESFPIKSSSTNHNIKGGKNQLINDMHANKSDVGPTSCNQRPGGGEKVIQQQYKDASVGPRKSPIKSKGNGKQKVSSVDEIIYMLNGLQINGDGQEQNALVPYKGDNRIVPYEEFDPIKKRKARPKVDLDPETDRIWRLLMGKEGSESTEATDKNKEKWWEEERKVFRGRADSFIARMHLVQGDRRFSRWKGSVIDSVIGVFLTQNVSDHLSSSAFMSLAAKFSLPSKPTNKSFYYKGAKPFIEEPESHLPNLGQIQRQPMIRPSFNTMHESPYDQRKHHLPSWTRTIPIQIGSTRNYSDPAISQTTEEIGSSSGSNFEAEDQTIGCRPMMIHGPTAQMLPQFYIHRAPINYNILHMQDSSASSHNLQSNRGVQTLGNVAEESTITSLSRQAVSTTHISRSASNQQQRMLSFQNPNMGPFLSRIPAQEGNIKWQENGNNQHSINHHQNSLNAEERISVFDKKNRVENNNSAEANGTEDVSSSWKRINGRKGKAEDEKNKAIDWDILRKQAQLNGIKERSKDTMDSLDYEALRCADVNEISNTIKERGMNNMLAERMKDFLNRMVREHGSIDLEWLRDVPPDKAKDYLLSVRGLGLKSVECVRLLTLHHLAFPVDTNVGRIAVRLGWVPLQPLPESLQLHLLELYPVLESIQKYLWPRLCKLDQRTLYELHYQMITFGKVFCTKSKPNCNACPMRAECRHFASAFASARLALPGPEEKSIVSSAVPLTPDKNLPVMTRPLALPPTENSSNKEVGPTTRNCEPIIEEPETPEPETTEITESDIEDAFYEDPDENPGIKLNMEEFKLNLHNYMEDNTELQDGDMSKALIALNPEAASIPTPKLKNVSRLRTEHQVYVLPDGHALLNGLDKREPDDPSPYLLAIWTPGETANSFQPSESNCRSQETGITCDDKACFSCNCLREANSQSVRGTILIPCRTAMRGSFPLNGTYFQVNEMFADHESSLNPIDVPRAWIWNLPRRTVYFGTSVSTIFKGLSTEGIQCCFWRGFVCVRGFDLKTRAPKPLMARLHFPASKLVKTKNEEKQKIALDSRTANNSR